VGLKTEVINGHIYLRNHLLLLSLPQMVTARAQNNVAIRYLYQEWATGFGAQHVCGKRARKLSTPSENNMACKSTVK